MDSRFGVVVCAVSLIAIAFYFYVRGEPNSDAHETYARWSMTIGCMMFCALIASFWWHGRGVSIGLLAGLVVGVLLDSRLSASLMHDRERAQKARQLRKRLEHRRDDAPPL